MAPRGRATSTASADARCRSRTPRLAEPSTPEKIHAPLRRGSAGSAPPAAAPPWTLFERASAALKPAAFDGRLPCRDVEQDRIATHLQTALRRGGSEQVLYISGMPGTGKTAALLHAIAQLEKSTSASKQAFTFVHINAMRLGTPGAVFNEILSHLPDTNKVALSAAQNAVHRYFSSRKPTSKVVILLIDEIDQLVTRNQGVLYSVFEWLGIRKSRLVVAAISNTMDLPERMLPRVASRFEIVRVDFWPYNRDQIYRILCERLRTQNALDAFATDALKRCSARVAAGSGDVRKALQLCKRSLELARNEKSGQVTGALLEGAARDMLYAHPATKLIAGFTRKTRILLVAFLHELRKQESEVVPLRKVASKYEWIVKLICGEDNLPCERSHIEDAALIADRLEDMAIITQHKKNAIHLGSLAGPGLSAGAGLDREDLSTALLMSENDPGVRLLLTDGDAK